MDLYEISPNTLRDLERERTFRSHLISIGVDWTRIPSREYADLRIEYFEERNWTV